MSKVLIVDGANFMYRARSGFQLGDFNVVYNFTRNLRSLVEKMEPTRVYFSLEGVPRRQLELLPSYKANRTERREAEAAKPVEGRRSEEDYRRQQEIIVRMLTHMLPITVVQHPDYEADDLIFNLVCRASSAIKFTIVSTDTDFLQMLQQFGNVKLYNPVTKAYMEAPQDYDYVHWKALRGDGSDNIPGLPGVGDVTATEALADPEKLRALLAEGDNGAAFTRNCGLIGFLQWNDNDLAGMRSSAPKRDWNLIKAEFESMAFHSLLKENTWTKFCNTFDSLWG